MPAKFLIVCCLICSLWLTTSAQQSFSGSTPADPEVRTALNISQNSPIDFIRWNLSFPHPRKFHLSLNYGESQPNTSGFKNGGTTAVIEGIYEIRTRNNATVYTLRTGKGLSISLSKLNQSLLHVLNSAGKFSKGNDGWSYTLSKRPSPEALKPAITSSMHNFTQPVTAFAGRTPCNEISKEYNFDAPSGCFKLKWVITFAKDSATASTGTYTTNRIQSRASIIKGRWNIDSSGIVKLTSAPGDTLFLFAADENVLFFLDKNGKLLPGNENFSYTLNMKDTPVTTIRVKP